MWIDLEDNKTKKLIHPIKDKIENLLDQNALFYLHSIYIVKISDMNGDQRISTFVYEIRTSPDQAVTLKNILYKVSMTNSNELTFLLLFL